ncbi:Homeodomain-related protein [Niveomyces insectorum RCEF 264]|uniref:Homeodomain-related protein n=1 Tax=Niveomyces insectorum RCEF 264 TaxID=1081102 RepID=A0A167ZR87_9HYPO|nr:Homeodomain-related protein [Niveomyces insectorum RCEF 264]
MKKTRPDVAQQPWGAQQSSPALSPMPLVPPLHSSLSPMPPMPPMSPIPPSPSPNPNPSSATFANPASPWYSAQHQYQQHINARRNDQMDFRPYGQQPPPGPGQQHHPGPVQPSMNIAQQHAQQHAQHAAQQHAPPQQHPPPPPPPTSSHTGSQPLPPPAASTPASTPTPQRPRKRPNPATAAPSAASASPVIPPPVPSTTPSAVTASSVPPPSTPVTATSSAPAGSVAPAATSSSSNVKAPPDESAANPTPPPAKKSRTNTPWTPAEEHRLKQMRDAGSSWAEIAKTFPTRTEGSVKKHWYKDMHYAEFAEDESAALLNAIKEYENQKWKVIGQKVGKPAKACEQYAKEHFADQVTAPTGKR